MALGREKFADTSSKLVISFFNSLVLAVYGGEPQWVEIGKVRSTMADPTLVKGDQPARRRRESWGFLRLTGKEKIFAVDGQHRLAGIKRALHDKVDIDADAVPVIFVGAFANETRHEAHASIVHDP